MYPFYNEGLLTHLDKVMYGVRKNYY